MKISISKVTVSAISIRAIPAAISVANVTREANSSLFVDTGFIPSNEEIINTMTNLDFKKMSIVNTKAVQISSNVDDVIVSIDDEYVKASLALVADLYGSLASPVLNVVKAALPLKSIFKGFIEKSTKLETKWNTPNSIQELSTEI